MDGENNGKPYEQMDDLGGPPLFLETPIRVGSPKKTLSTCAGFNRIASHNPPSAKTSETTTSSPRNVVPNLRCCISTPFSRGVVNREMEGKWVDSPWIYGNSPRSFTMQPECFRTFNKTKKIRVEKKTLEFSWSGSF